MADDSKVRVKPYQFYLPSRIHAQGIRKAEENEIAIAPFMKMAWEQFIDKPIEELMRMLKAHKRKQKEKRRKPKPKPIKITKGVTLNK